jgi:hypothetical protein
MDRGSQAPGRRFTYYSYGAAAALLQSLASQYPLLASLSTTQATFGLPPVGKCREDHGVDVPCLNYVLEITNRTGSEADRRARPQIYISGALHGDEQVGVVTALELCRWLTERYEFDPWVSRLSLQPTGLPILTGLLCARGAQYVLRTRCFECSLISRAGLCLPAHSASPR